MKPTFALDLTREAIALLHRTPKGWLTIGEVAFDAPDLGDGLDYLRKTALGLAPMGVASKVIIPNSQILYLELHAPGPSREDKRRQIIAGLAGRTPYEVEDLIFDWSGKGATVKVAVVARETLNEAEDFAVAHRLNPVSFAAVPEEGTFVGEAWFGPSAAADTILAPGEVVERDRDAVSIIAAPATATPKPVTEAAPDPKAAKPETAEPETFGVADDPTPAAVAGLEDDDPLPGLQEALEAEVTDADLAAGTASATGAAVGDLDEITDPFAEDDAADPAMADLDAFWRDPPPVTPEPAPAAPVPEPSAEVEEAPFQHIDDSAGFADEPDAKPVAKAVAPASVLSPDLADADVPPAPSVAAMLAFSSRRSPATESAPRPAIPPAAPSVLAPTAASPVEARFTAPVSRPTPPARTFPGLVTAPSIPGTRAKSKTKPTGEVARPASLGPVTVKSPARPGGTFGSTAPPRNRTGFVFMIMVGLLLLSLALVAAWASFFLTQSAEGNGTATMPATELAADIVAVPAIEDEMAADMQDPEELAGLAPEAAAEVSLTDAPDADLAADIDADLAAEDVAVEDVAVNIGGDASGLAPTSSVAEALADPVQPADAVTEVAATEIEAAPEVVPEADPEADPGADPGADPETLAETLTETAAVATDEPAPASIIATEVSGDLVPVADQDEIFLSAMDAPPPALDALALPAPIAVADAPPDPGMPPPAFGTVYQFGPDGLLKPTPEGILSPAGVMLIAGKPSLLPPARSEVAAAAAAATVTAAAPAPVAPAKPASAPATAADASLVTAGDATAEVAAEIMPGILPETLPEPDPAMAGFRPRPRPEGLAPVDDGAGLKTETLPSDITLRPLPRPAVVLAAAAAARPAGDLPADPLATATDLGAQGASLTAQADAKRAAAEALEAENPSIVAISMRPAARPTDLSRAVEAAVAAAVREPEPEAVVELAAAAPEDGAAGEEIDEPEVEGSAPSIPTKASVAKQATYKNAINLGKINLIGTYGTSSGRYALVRQANGNYKKVEVGDKIDGGVIKAITETEVRYQKGGKLISLAMPKA